MRRFLPLLLLFLLIAPTSAGAIVLKGKGGVFAVDCQRTERKPLDPIVMPGMPGMSHSHDFFGPVSVPNSAKATDLLSGPNSCDLAQDHSAYWMPTLYSSMGLQEGDNLQIYYRLDNGAVAIPKGIQMIAGDAARLGATNPAWSSYSCQPSSSYNKTNPPSCPRSGWILTEIDFPQCWNGKQLDSPNHKSHTAYSGSGKNYNSLGCPKTHPVRIAQVVMFRNFNQYAGLLQGVTLASGPASTLHADFVSGWDAGVFNNLIANCAAKDCGHIKQMPANYHPGPVLKTVKVRHSFFCRHQHKLA